MTIAVLGAGAVGTWVGASWGATLIGREGVLAPLREAGLRLTGGGDRHIAPGDIRIAGPEALANADLIALTVKSTALSRAVDDLTTHARPDVPILCLMNGLAPVRDLRAALPNPVLRGMVPFNVVWRGAAHLHRSSAGHVAVEDAPATRGLPDTEARTDMEALQHGKLLLNLINPINALSGLPLRQMLSRKPWRLVYAATVDEALRAYAAKGIVHTKAGPIPPAWSGPLLRLPDAIFVHTLLRLQKIDAESMTSMASDLAGGHQTEIDTLNGEIARLAPGGAPVNAGLVRLIHAAEKGGCKTWTARDLAAEIGLSGA